MYTLVVDPESWLLDSVASINRDLSLAIGNLSLPMVTVQPNPAKHSWTISGLQTNSSMELTDVTGRIFWHADAIQDTKAVIPAANLATGLYILRVTNEGKLTTSCKLLKE